MTPPISDEALWTIASKMGAFGIDIEAVADTGLLVSGPDRVCSVADLASALLAAREAARAIVAGKHIHNCGEDRWDYCTCVEDRLRALLPEVGEKP